MRYKYFFSALVQVIPGALLLLASTPRLSAAEVNVARTNWTELWITNVIDVRMPTNVFVTEYQTNFVSVFKTNYVSVTNPVAVNAWHTNFVTRYQTNSKVLNLTNWETVLA